MWHLQHQKIFLLPLLLAFPSATLRLQLRPMGGRCFHRPPYI